MDRDRALALIDTEISKAEAAAKAKRDRRQLVADNWSVLEAAVDQGIVSWALTAKPKGTAGKAPEPCPIDPAHYPTGGKPGDLFQRLKRHMRDTHPDQYGDWLSTLA